MIENRAFSDALLSMLTAATGTPVGDGRRPDGKPDHYYILYRVDRVTSGAPYSDLNEDATLVYQITSVSAPDLDIPDSFGARNQLEWLEDKARTAVLGRHPVTRRWLYDITAPGIKVMGRRSETEPGGTPDATDGIMSSAIRFAFDLTST